MVGADGDSVHQAIASRDVWTVTGSVEMSRVVQYAQNIYFMLFYD